MLATEDRVDREIRREATGIRLQQDQRWNVHLLTVHPRQNRSKQRPIQRLYRQQCILS
jgi:hypothetical protein